MARYSERNKKTGRFLLGLVLLLYSPLVFFIFMALAVILSVFGDWAEGKRINAVIASVLIVVIIGVAVGKPVGYIEIASVACFVLWLFSEGAKMAVDVKAAGSNPETA